MVMSSSPPAVGERKTFSNVTRLGFAAAHDSPALKNEDSLHRTSLKIDSPGMFRDIWCVCVFCMSSFCCLVLSRYLPMSI